jgi:hypothetical protein
MLDWIASPGPALLDGESQRRPARSSPDSPQEGGVIEPSVPPRGSDKSCSMSRNLLYFLRETEGSKSVSLQQRVHVSREFAFPRRKAGLFRGCARRGRQKRHGARYCTDIFADRAGLLRQRRSLLDSWV